MSDSSEIDYLEKELLDRNTTAERVQEIFNGFINSSQIVIKKVTLENGIFAVLFVVDESRDCNILRPLSGWLPPFPSRPSDWCPTFKKKNPEYTLHFPKDKLTNDQIVKLLDSVKP